METGFLWRLSSFVKCPSSVKICPSTLARIGFHYKEEGDTLTCSSCNVNLEPNICSLIETLMGKHKQLSPHCSLTHIDTEGDIQQGDTALRINDTTTDYSSFHIRSIGRDTGDGDTQVNAATWSTGNVSTRLHLLDSEQLLVESSRLSTFRDWPLTAKGRPHALARDGLFYTGTGDSVQCAFCRGCIGNWEATDVPSTRHRDRFPGCPFVLGLEVGNVSLIRDDLNDISTSQPSMEASNFPPLRQNLLVANSGALRVEPREIKARMDTPCVRIVLSMGYGVNLVKEVLENRFSNTGDDFQSAEHLLEAIFAHQEETESAPSEYHPQASNISVALKEEVDLSLTSDLNPTNLELRIDEESDEEATEHDEDLLFVEENRRLREARSCKLCMNAEVNTVFLPCGHLVCCSACSTLVNACPICRVCVKGTVKTFLS